MKHHYLICSTCKEVKPIKEFSRYKLCKTCYNAKHREYVKERRIKDPIFAEHLRIEGNRRSNEYKARDRPKFNARARKQEKQGRINLSDAYITKILLQRFNIPKPESYKHPEIISIYREQLKTERELKAMEGYKDTIHESRTCKNCNKVFTIYTCRLNHKKQEGIYCSKKCKHEAQKGQPLKLTKNKKDEKSEGVTKGLEIY
jgi:hypothetical protein